MSKLEKRKLRRFPPAVWAAAKKDYHAGMSAPLIEATHGIKAETFRKRAMRDGFTRKVVWEAEQAALESGEAARGEEAAAFVQPSSAEIVEVSLMRAVEALRRGNAAEATRLAEAGSKVGEFAELVKLVRAREA